MGSYADLEISGYPILLMKSYVDPEVMTLFRECDKKIYERRVSERSPLVWHSIEDDHRIETAYVYSIEAKYAAQRLDVMGFTLSQAEKQFREGVKATIGEISEGGICLDLWWMAKNEQVPFLSQHTFDKWMSLLRTLIEKRITPWNDEGSRAKEGSPSIRFILEGRDEFYYGFPLSDIRHFIRAVSDLLNPNDVLILDTTELVDAGYYDGTEKLTQIALDSYSKEYLVSSTIIVLTEGSTDANALSQTLALLYPHLSEYYSFLDFRMSNMEGGAANLVRIVKAFIGSGIINRVIALFDNDTAAQVAMRGLQNLSIPENIVTMRYPPVSYAENYPTIGPQGISSMNVNGLAGSLELYFGEDVLKDNSGRFTPVQWKGYDQSLKQYQGELVSKSALQSSYSKKVERCARGEASISDYDWSGMRAILEGMFSAFDRC